MNEYDKYLAKVEKVFNKFMKKAKAIKANDKGPENMSIKSEAIRYNIELRSLLQKFRGNS